MEPVTMGKAKQFNTGIELTPSAGFGTAAAVSSRGRAIGTLSIAEPRVIVTPYRISADRIEPVAGTAHPFP